MSYLVKVFVSHGYYEYSVPKMEQALAHGQAIMHTGVYRHANEDDSIEFFTAYKVKVCGEGLKSEYPDTFRRT